MAATEESENGVVLSMLKTINDSVTSLKNDNKELRERLESLETPPPASGVVRNSNMRITQEHDNDSQSGVSMGDAGRIFEASMPSENDDVDIQPHSITFPNKVGPNLGFQLANMINNDLVGQDDMAQLRQIHEKYVRPENIPNLVVPKLNEEVNPTDTVLTRETGLCNIQQNITSAISIIADLIDDQSKTSHKYTRQDIFNKANETLSVLIHTHKSVSLSRKQNVKHLLKDNIQFLCTKKHDKETRKRSNRELFEEDLGNEVDRAYRNKKVMNKVAKNYRGGASAPQRFSFGQGQRSFSRGRGALRGGVLKKRSPVQLRA